jgi:hypothetical protein
MDGSEVPNPDIGGRQGCGRSRGRGDATPRNEGMTNPPLPLRVAVAVRGRLKMATSPFGDGCEGYAQGKMYHSTFTPDSRTIARHSCTSAARTVPNSSELKERAFKPRLTNAALASYGFRVIDSADSLGGAKQLA